MHTCTATTSIAGMHSSVTLQAVVLPLIGSGVQLPTNAIGALYEQAISEGKVVYTMRTTRAANARMRMHDVMTCYEIACIKSSNSSMV
jgi:hypothetical protein